MELGRSLLDSVDLSLQAAMSQAAGTIEAEKSGPVFRNKGDVDVVVRNRGQLNFAVRLLSKDKQVADGDGAFRNGPLWPAAEEGFATVAGRGGSWRVLTESINAKEEPVLGWIQVAEPITYVTDAMDHLKTVLLLAIPLMLLLAGAGGVLLVHEALKPISKVIATAQSISSNDLSGRIAYTGPEDELARLARTFDRMIDRLQEAFEQERRFSADASHELRTPLTALKGQIEVALSRDRTPAEYREILNALMKESNRLVRLANDLLLLSRIGIPRRPAAEESVNLGDLVLATVEQISPFAESKGLSLTTTVPDTPVETVGDFNQLARLFLNLLDNAVKYTPQGGAIRTSVNLSAPAWVEVAIANTGPGFSREHQAHVFERFYRVQTDRSRDSGGSGLGLAIAKEIVHSHGGQIIAESEPDGVTTFTVRLQGRAFG